MTVTVTVSVSSVTVVWQPKTPVKQRPAIAGPVPFVWLEAVKDAHGHFLNRCPQLDLRVSTSNRARWARLRSASNHALPCPALPTCALEAPFPSDSM